MSKNVWDLSDTSKHWDIERQLTAMINGGKVRYYDRVFEGSVEDVRVNSDGTADVDVYGESDKDPKGHFHFHLRLYADGTFTVENCHKK